MAKRKSVADLLNAANLAGSAIQAQDRVAEARAELEQSLSSSLPIGKILDRVSDTRELDAQHISDLAESIEVVGLLEPLVVDRRGRLLAGGHRKAAILMVKEQKPEIYEQFFPNDLTPVRILGFDAEEKPDLALQIEITENEKRRDYTSAEVKALAQRLLNAGYADVKGRPARGEKALRPALEIIIGKSIRTVRRYLNEAAEESVTDVRLSSEKHQDSPVPALKRLQTELTRWQRIYPESESAELQMVTRDVARLLKRVEGTLKKLEN